MTVSSTTRTAGPFAGNGVQIDFPFTMRVFADTDIVATETDTSGSTSTLVLGSDYTVAVNSDQRDNPGGMLTMLSPLTSLHTLNLTTAMEPTQGARLTNAGGFYPEVIENALDKLTILIQEATTSVSRLVRVPYPETLDELPDAPTRAGYLVAFDSSGDLTLAAPASGSAAALALDLADYTNTAKGAGQVGYLPSYTGAVGGFLGDWLDEFIMMRETGASATDSALLRACITAAETKHIPVLLPAGRIYYDGTAIANDRVRLWGRGMPTVNSGKTALAGGSIVEGKLIFTGKYIDLRDFGVDLGSAGAGPDADGIKVTCATLNGGVHLHAENLVALCKSSASAVHSLLFESYLKFTGGNLYGVYGYFGCVIKCQGVQLSSIDTSSTGDTGLYLKSDSTYGTCGDVQIDTVRVRSATTMGVRIQSDSAAAKNFQIGKLHISDCDRSVAIQVLDPSGLDLPSVHIGTLISERAVTADLSMLSLRVGKYINNVQVDNLVAIDGTGKAVETSCTSGAFIRHLQIGRVYASYPSGALQATMDSAVFLDGGVLSSDLGGVEIVENYGTGSKFGAINYQTTSDPKYHALGSHRCKVIGPGRPLPGNLNQTLSGATATLLIPENINGGDRSYCRVTIAAGATITTFSPEWSTQTFNFGHQLYVYNNSAFTLSVGHNPAQGIINQGSATVNLAGSEVACWIHIGGGVWSQLKIA